MEESRESTAQRHPDKKVIRLSIGDVTQPLAPAIIERLHKAVDEMAVAETFKGYAPDLGYEFLRNTIAKNDYADRGVDISADEIFVSDGQRVTQQISRRYLQQTARSQYVILYTLYMLIQM